MWVLIIVFSGLSFFNDEPIMSVSTHTQEFRSQRKCVAAQEWVLEKTDAQAACFKK
jgi:hypothetical protein